MNLSFRETLSPALGEKINEQCDRFEAAWKTAPRPRLEDFVTLADEPGRTLLLRELILLELAYRRRNGDKPLREDYACWFPDQPERVQALFEAAGLAEPETVDGAATAAHEASTLSIQAPAQGNPAKAAASSDATSVPGYEILDVLGRGGMGVVYKARQIKADRVVALKMILAGGHASKAELGRFTTEAHAVARLQHPNIVQIYDVGEHRGLPYFSLEYCAGGTLAQKIAGTPVQPHEAASVVEKLARAMHAAHEKNIIHRDLKPANILLHLADEAANSTLQVAIPKITDFGLAKKLDDAGQTHTGAVMGTPSYMPPEQADGRTNEVGPLADVYALGAILYELLTGRPPFRGATPMDTIMQVLTKEPVPPAQLNPGTPRDLETICLKCLQKDAGRRYGSALALAEELRRFQAGEPILARPVGKAERAWRWCRRKPALAGLFAVSVVAVLVTLALSYWYLYRLADARGKTALAEGARITEARQRQAAEDLAQARQYFVHLTEARERIWQQEAGWPSAALELVEKAAALPTSARNPAELRSAAAAALAGIEIRPAGKLGQGFSTSVLAFNPNGQQLALGESRTSGLNQFALRLRIVDFPSGKLIRELNFPIRFEIFLRTAKPDGSRSIAWSNDGRWLALGTRHGDVHVWDLTTTDGPRTLDIGGQYSGRIAFSRDSQFLYTTMHPGSGSGILKRWRLADGIKEVGRRSFDRIDGLAIPADPHRILLCESGRILLLDADTETLDEKLAIMNHSGEVATTADGRIALVSRDHHIDWVDPTTLDIRHTFRSHRDDSIAALGIAQVRGSSDGRTFLTRSSNVPNLQFWDAVTGRHVAEWPVLDGSADAHFSPSGQYVAVAGKDEIQVLEVFRREEHRTTTLHLNSLSAMALSHDGSTLTTLINTNASELAIHMAAWKVNEKDSSSPLFQREMGNPRRQVAFSAHACFHPERLECVCTSSSDSLLQVVDITTNTVPWAMEVSGPRAAAYTPNGAQLWVAHALDVLVVEGAGSNRKTLHWHNIWADVNGVGTMKTVAAGADWCVAGDVEGFIHLFSTKLPDDPKQFSTVWTTQLGYRLDVTALDISRNQDWIIAGDRVGNLYRINRVTQKVNKHAAHKQGVTTLCCIGNDQFVTGSRDGSVRFWHWKDAGPEELYRLPASGAVLQLSLSRDNNTLAVLVERERGVHLWNLAALRKRFASMNLEMR